MTNKVKPFYIKITDDMTPQMVQDAFDKCVDAGAKLDEGCRGVKSKHEYKKQYNPSNFKFFGVDDSFITYMDIDLEYFTNAQEITLDQLDKWLGLEVNEEWNGEGLPPVGSKVMTSFTESDCDSWCDFHGPSEIIAYHGDYVWVAHHGKFNRVHALSDIEFEKPETPEQKAEREKKEAIDDIKGTIDFFADSYMSALSLYEQGYRKQ